MTAAKAPADCGASKAHGVSTKNAPIFLPEIVELLAAYLVGYDVLHLAHVCRTFREILSVPQVWADRIASQPGGPISMVPRWCAAQAAYFMQTSFLFRGQTSLYKLKRGLREKLSLFRHKLACGDATELPYALLPRHGRITFEVWFSVVGKPREKQQDGGILLGLQSESCFSGREPEVYQHFVMIDHDRNLHCSVLPSKPIIAKGLTVNHWYHLALVFDGQHQSVYLDGELVSSGYGLGRIADKWHWVRHAQIGTGYVGAISATEGYHHRGKGWRPFRGIVDDFRLWTEVLDEDQVRQLAARREIDKLPSFTFSNDATLRCEGVKQVKCSRPVERQLVLHRRGALPAAW